MALVIPEYCLEKKNLKLGLQRMMKVKFVCYCLMTVLILNVILVTTSVVQSLNGPGWTLTGPDNISGK